MLAKNANLLATCYKKVLQSLAVKNSEGNCVSLQESDREHCDAREFPWSHWTASIPSEHLGRIVVLKMLANVTWDHPLVLTHTSVRSKTDEKRFWNSWYERKKVKLIINIKSDREWNTSYCTHSDCFHLPLSHLLGGNETEAKKRCLLSVKKTNSFLSFLWRHTACKAGCTCKATHDLVWLVYNEPSSSKRAPYVEKKNKVKKINDSLNVQNTKLWTT